MKNVFSSIRLEVTSKCNINCKYCHNADYANKQNDLTTDELKKLILSLKKEYPINKVLLTGGEPLLNADIVDFIQFLDDLNIKTDMVTNGKLLSKNLVLDLEKAGLRRIRISIDGFKEHEVYRKGSNVNELWDICEYIKKNTKLNLVIHTVCSPHNVSIIDKIYDKLIEIGADRWRVFDIGYSGAAVRNLSMFGLASYYEEFVENVSHILKKYISSGQEKKLDIEVNGVFKTNLLGNVYDNYYTIDNQQILNSVIDASPCDYIHHQMTIRSNGIGTLCQYFHNTIFDFRKYLFDAKEAREKANHTVESTLKLREIHYCRSCKYVLICNSGCRAKAEFLTGNIKNPDPVACVIMPLFFDKIIPVLDAKTRLGFEKLLIGDKAAFYSMNDLHNFICAKLGGE